ncbi:putative lipase atg15 [Teratosphaeriaceae sp. CCFEE 6253]|nr:putative lipase atg15 [Teratosphaeriaceae sp. CCFEE 6253]
MWTASACIALLLVLASSGNAARTPQQRKEHRNPYLILPPSPGAAHEPSRDLGERSFSLRHIYHHGSHQYPSLHRYLDISANDRLRVTSDYGETHEAAPESLRVQAVSTTIQRLAKRKPADIDRLLEHAGIHGEAATLPPSAWTDDDAPGPNVTDKQSVLTFAKMASNAYVQDHTAADWKDVKGGFNYTDDFGWQQDGLRGHIFADEKNATVVIGLKGTSPAVFDGADTTGNDKLNDNLFGSCCCGQGGQYLWKQVCDCMTSTYTWNSTCLVKSLREKSHYYWAVRDLYHNVTERYPNSEVWLAGHSLGGVVSGLLGLTYGLPTMTFEAFPDALGASRLGLPTPPGYKIGSHHSRASTGIYHIGHTADPIYMGTCNAASSFCTIGGYAFQGVCHTGQTCIYDTVGDLGWRVGVGTHKITNVISDVIEKYDTVPACETDVDCQDCVLWKFFDSNGTETTTSSSSSSSSTRTRTETCKTPGWWGCLDESTTTSATTTTTTTSASSTSTSSSSTSTCKTPGWFGCKDPTTTTSSSSTVVTTPSAAPAPTLTTTSSLPTGTSTCHAPGWFGGCLDESTTSAAPSSTAAHTTPKPTAASPSPSGTAPVTQRKKCVDRNWYGTCRQWRVEGWGVKNDL